MNQNKQQKVELWKANYIFCHGMEFKLNEDLNLSSIDLNIKFGSVKVHAILTQYMSNSWRFNLIVSNWIRINKVTIPYNKQCSFPKELKAIMADAANTNKKYKHKQHLKLKSSYPIIAGDSMNKLLISGYCRNNYKSWLPIEIINLFYKFYDFKHNDTIHYKTQFTLPNNTAIQMNCTSMMYRLAFIISDGFYCDNCIDTKSKSSLLDNSIEDATFRMMKRGILTTRSKEFSYGQAGYGYGTDHSESLDWFPSITFSKIK